MSYTFEFPKILSQANTCKAAIPIIPVALKFFI